MERNFPDDLFGHIFQFHNSNSDLKNLQVVHQLISVSEEWGINWETASKFRCIQARTQTEKTLVEAGKEGKRPKSQIVELQINSFQGHLSKDSGLHVNPQP